MFDLLPLDQASYDAIDQQLETDYEQVGKEWFEATGGNVEGDDADELPVQDLSLSDSSEKGKGKASTKQPAFYDVAYNYVVAFDMEAIAKKAGLRKDTEDDTVTRPTEATESDIPGEGTVAGEENQSSTPSKRGWGFGLFGRR